MIDEDLVLGVSYGGGVDSTAMLVGFKRLRIVPDFILFADVGDEKPETYEFIEEHMRPWLRSVGFPDITVVRYVPQRFKHGPYSTLFENCMVNSTLPSLAFGRKACSNKWKIAPMDKWVREQYGQHLAEGNQIARCIGYDAGPKDSCRGGNVTDCDDFVYLYPLREWGWDRDQCKLEIAKEGLTVPPKSACFFCPSTQKDELVQLAIDHPELARKAVEMEDKAQPNLKAIQGLWRNGVKGTRKPESKRPGRWREYLEQEGYGHLFEGSLAAKDKKMTVDIKFAPAEGAGHEYQVVDTTITKDGEYLMEIPKGPLPVSFFEMLPKGTEIRLYYWATNKGDFVWKHDHVEEKDVGASSYRVYGTFYHPGKGEWVPVDDYLYEFMGDICRGSGAEPVHAFEPDEPDR